MQSLVAVQVVIERSVGFLAMVCRAVVSSLFDSLKAMLPCGVLPRKSIKGEVMLITGTGSGIGRLCAIEFAKLGARVVLWDINENANRETRNLIETAGYECSDYTVDMSQRDQIYATAERVKREVGEVDILLNNAGIVSGKKLFDCPDELMERTMAVNCNALFYTTKAFLPSMLERDHGHIVTMASMGHFGVNGLVDYCASKHAAVGFNEALRSELIAHGKNISVTTISPFYVDTGMFAGIKSYSPIMFPLLKPEFVVEGIVEAVLTNASFVSMPKTTYIYFFLKGYSSCRTMDIIVDYFGLNRTMDSYVGRQGGDIATTAVENGKTSGEHN